MTASARFTITDPSKVPAVDPRITHDAQTGLDWQTIPLPESMAWAEAEKACKTLNLGGHDDWRLPTREELLTLVDDTRRDPAIDTEAFPDCPSSWFWTATPYAANPSAFAWIVYFHDGDAVGGLRGNHGRVRAVRVVSRKPYHPAFGELAGGES